MELDLSRLNEIDFKDKNKAPDTPQNAQKDKNNIEHYKQEKERLQTNSDDLKGIKFLQDVADNNKAEKDRAIEIYKQYQESNILTSQLQTEITKGIQVSADIYDLFLKAIKAISLMTSNELFYTKIEADIRAVYGVGLLEKSPLENEIKETKKRLQRLIEAQERELEADTKERIRKAIVAHKKRIDQLTEYVQQSKKNI